MIIDASTKMSNAQAVTASAASANVIDMKAAGDAYGQDLYLVVQCVETATSANASTLDIKIQTDNDDAFGSPTQIGSSGAIPKASLVANKIIYKQKLPLGLEKNLRLYYEVAVANLTAGKFTAFLTPDIQTNNK